MSVRTSTPQEVVHERLARHSKRRREMSEITDPRALFVHQLGEALSMERTTLTILKRNEEAAGDPELQRLFGHHREETEGQIRNLESAFSALGEDATGHVCHGMEGMKNEAAELTEKVAPNLRDGALAGGATHVEHYEIATYESLRGQAEAMGEQDVVALLQENLEQEQHTLQEIDRAAQRLVQLTGGRIAS
jgi:ferritin-like metal-binding protein YciE